MKLKLNSEVLTLGLLSFLTDLSSEAIFSVFAVFSTAVARVSSGLLGPIEGLADFSASSLNCLAGRKSYRSGKRKVFALAGYGFSTLVKTILLASTSIAGRSAFRVIERLGKGFRGPPRDALLARLADPATRGYSFGMHKALDMAGAVFGPLVAGPSPEDWQFQGDASPRTHRALRLAPDLELGLADVALVVDLLAEIDRLRSRLRRR